MPDGIKSLLTKLDLEPVLMDLGATGEPPVAWREIAGQSTYVGIGPDAKPPGNPWDFKTVHLIDKLLTETETERVTIYLAKNRLFTSVLPPHPSAITNFVELDLDPEGESSLPACTINSIVEDLRLPGIDWLNSNINSLDVPIFQSLHHEVRQRILVVDTCLDFVELFIGQDSGIARFPEFVAQGFWLAGANTYGPVRMRRDSLNAMNALDPAINEQLLRDRHRLTPGWLFVRFLRTTEWLDERDSPPRDYALLWMFALLSGQVGFAADVMFSYKRRFGSGSLFRIMEAETQARFKELTGDATLVKIAKRVLPDAFRHRLRRMLRSV